VLARLGSLGCHEAQGFLIARPLPEPEARNWLTEHGGGRQTQEEST